MMRSEQEMFDLILNTARDDERIRAVILNGSRANPNAPRDIFQDYDIVYLVTEVVTFTADPTWIDRFGERIILQLPDAMDDPPPQDGRFGYLMQFTDGNRIDLGLFPIANLALLTRDSLSMLLLDKDGIIPPFPPANDSDYLPRPPTAKQFANCCNEFWWVCPYVAKGLWREEIIYAHHMLDNVVRQQLLMMVTWYVGVRTSFARGPGDYGRGLRKYLEPELWAMLETTYADASRERTWNALVAMCDLFRITATRVALHCGLAYPRQDDERVGAHLRHVRSLPRDAQEIYPGTAGR
jgi:aminoglycoside 6-adenylyltransferase